MDAVRYEPIGVIHSPFRETQGMPVQPTGAKGVEGRVELLPQCADGLADLEGFSHVILLYHFHRSQGYALKVTPFLDSAEHGVFATRAPRRPNAIGLSVVGLSRVEGHWLHIVDVDVLDGTPLLDIKPFVPAFDVREGARTGWLQGRDHGVSVKRSDGRFGTGGGPDDPASDSGGAAPR